MSLIQCPLIDLSLQTVTQEVSILQDGQTMNEPRDTKTLLLKTLSSTLAMEQESKLLQEFYSLKKQTSPQFFPEEEQFLQEFSEGMEVINQRLLFRLQSLSSPL